MYDSIIEHSRTVSQVVQEIKNSLRHLYSDGEVNYIIRIIFEKLMNYSRTDIIVRHDNVIESDTGNRIRQIIDELLTGKPIQYIFGEARFYGRDFFVNSHTLIPRPETEQIIEIIDNDNKDKDLRVLDIGTGSGCIAVTLARILKFPTIDALDISEEALAVAAENASKFKVKINLINADIFNYNPNDTYDIIVSNPPYVCNDEKMDMYVNVLDFEPHSALFVPNDNPLVFYKRITELAQTNLKAGGGIYFEINPRFANEIETLLLNAGMEKVKIIEDIHYKLRFASARKPKLKHLFL
ncbi:MAG: peptide chain release factor N(5)-glutamine methyltransferase [Muribaculaceae bacterium]|nr:peptide chain release factor N(5)-glutamine methyltransferase [Muribaculaceae bacterium]